MSEYGYLLLNSDKTAKIVTKDKMDVNAHFSEHHHSDECKCRNWDQESQILGTLKINLETTIKWANFKAKTQKSGHISA